MRIGFNLTLPIIVGVSYIFALIFLNNSLFSLAICLALVYFFIIKRNPIIHFYHFLLVNVSFLGFLNPEVFFRLPGIFKFIDLLFGIFIVLYILNKYPRKLLAFQAMKNFRVEKTIKFFLWSIIFFTLFQMGITSFRYDVSLLSCFKIGRHYLYFFTGIIAIDIFSKKADGIKILKFLFFLANLQSVLIILQNILGSKFFFLGYTKMISQPIGGAVVQRIYMPAGFYVMAVFIMAFWMFFLQTNIFSKKKLIYTVLLTGIAIFLSYTRTIWVMAFIGVLLPLCLISKKAFLKYIVFSFIIFVFAGSSFILLGGKKMDIIKIRITSIYDEVANYNGNFAIRFEENIARLDLIRKNIILGGPGFVHTDQAPDVFNFNTVNKNKRATYVQTNDSGFLTWLLAFGGVGVLWVVLLLKWLLKCTKRAIKLQYTEVGAIVGIASYIFSVWVTSLTTTGFTYSKGVITLSVLLYIFAVLINEEKSGICT